MDGDGSTKRSFLGHAAIYGLGNVLIYAGNFVLLPLYVRYLSEAEYGALDLLKHLGGVLTLCLFYNGIRQALFAFYNQAECEEERRVVVGSILSVTAMFFLVGGLGLMAWSRSLAGLLEVREPALLQLALVAVLAESFSLLLLALAQARQESTFFVTVSVAQFLCRSLLCIIFVAGLRWGIRGAFFASLVTAGAQITYLLARELRRHALALSRGTVLSALWFALPFIPGGIGFFILHSGDRFFLVKNVSGAQLGAYALGYKLAFVVVLLSRHPLYQVWSARMYKVAKQSNAPVVFGQTLTRILAAYLFVGLGLCVLNREVVSLLAGERFVGAAAVIAPIVLAYFFLTGADLMDAGLYVSRRTVWKTLITAISTFTTLSLYAILIPKHGIMGAALATLLGFIVHSIVTLTVTQRIFPVRYEWYRLFVLLVSALGFWMLSKALPSSWWWSPARLLLCLAWPVLLWKTNVVSTEEKRMATDLGRRAQSFLQDRLRLRSRREPIHSKIHGSHPIIQ